MITFRRKFGAWYIHRKIRGVEERRPGADTLEDTFKMAYDAMLINKWDRVKVYRFPRRPEIMTYEYFL
jgi:hypothetical protein